MAACRQCGRPTERMSHLVRYCRDCVKARDAASKQRYKRDVLGCVPRDDARTPPAVEYVPGDLSAASIERILARLELTQRLARKAGPPSNVRKFEPVEPLADEDSYR
jgi:NMD protein affecting ribosome stability and mRNA decay